MALESTITQNCNTFVFLARLCVKHKFYKHECPLNRIRGDLMSSFINKSLKGMYTNKQFKRYWRFVRRLILERDLCECRLCYRKTKLTVHHIDNKGFAVTIPERNDAPYNLITLCERCHNDVEEGNAFCHASSLNVPDWCTFEDFVKQL